MPLITCRFLLFFPGLLKVALFFASKMNLSWVEKVSGRENRGTKIGRDLLSGKTVAKNEKVRSRGY